MDYGLVQILVVGVVAAVVIGFFILRAATAKARRAGEVGSDRLGASFRVLDGAQSEVHISPQLDAGDRVRLALGALANMINVTSRDSIGVRYVLCGLFRPALESVENAAPDMFVPGLQKHLQVSSGLGILNQNDNLNVALIKGRSMKYTLTDFAPVGQPFGIAYGVASIYLAIAESLDGTWRCVLRDASLMLASADYDGLIDQFRNQQVAASVFDLVWQREVLWDNAAAVRDEVREVLSRVGA